MSDLTAHIKTHESIGSFDASGSLGFKKMPEGYALMLNPERTHFYWLSYEGEESCIHWNKWAVYKWAKYARKYAKKSKDNKND